VGSNVEQLDENLAALDGPVLSDEELAEIGHVLA
jgi:aryl-alcohol dehydrogenase-like predicted oxidoreductase